MVSPSPLQPMKNPLGCEPITASFWQTRNRGNRPECLVAVRIRSPVFRGEIERTAAGLNQARGRVSALRSIERQLLDHRSAWSDREHGPIKRCAAPLEVLHRFPSEA